MQIRQWLSQRTVSGEPIKPQRHVAVRTDAAHRACPAQPREVAMCDELRTRGLANSIGYGRQREIHDPSRIRCDVAARAMHQVGMKHQQAASTRMAMPKSKPSSTCRRAAWVRGHSERTIRRQYRRLVGSERFLIWLCASGRRRTSCMPTGLLGHRVAAGRTPLCRRSLTTSLPLSRPCHPGKWAIQTS